MLSPGPGRSKGLHLGLPQRWQRPKNVCHLLLLCQDHQQRARLEMKQLECEPVSKGDANVTGGRLIYKMGPHNTFFFICANFILSLIFILAYTQIEYFVCFYLLLLLKLFIVSCIYLNVGVVSFYNLICGEMSWYISLKH